MAAPATDLHNSLSLRLATYRRWCEELAGTIREYQDWVEKNELADGVDDLRVYELLEQLKSDKLTVALVAEFSRGKTELINAIFFADTKTRLLPSLPGRTTMCPTEIRYDENTEPSIRLLPIETRKNSSGLAELRRETKLWTTLALDLAAPQKMAETLGEIIRTQKVPVREAQALNLYSPGQSDGPPVENGQVEIPVWRHAIINYPHPLLQQGLVVLDTPGLNALGTEPELTMGMLPKAQAVLFLLAADTGVTKSDLDVWQQHIKSSRGASASGCLAVLNKIDTLWDELREPAAIARTIASQAEDTARILGIDRARVFPVSAQKGLLGKIRGDRALVLRSGLPALEIKLSQEIIPERQRYLRERVAQEIGTLVESTHTMIAARLEDTESQIAEFKALGGKNLDTIQNTLSQLRVEQAAYNKRLEGFQGTRTVLTEQIRHLLEALSIPAFDALIARTRKDMKESWTTHGLKVGMASFFQGANDVMEKVSKNAFHIQGLLDAIYQKFHTEHGLPRMKPPVLQVMTYRHRLQSLHEDGEAFRTSAVLLVTEEHFVINRFFITLVSRAREIFTDCNAEAQAWSKAVMNPIVSQLQEHKQSLEKRIEHLKGLQTNLDRLSGHISELEATRDRLARQHATIKTLLARIHQPAAG